MRAKSEEARLHVSINLVLRFTKAAKPNAGVVKKSGAIFS